MRSFQISSVDVVVEGIPIGRLFTDRVLASGRSPGAGTDYRPWRIGCCWAGRGCDAAESGIGLFRDRRHFRLHALCVKR